MPQLFPPRISFSKLCWLTACAMVCPKNFGFGNWRDYWGPNGDLLIWSLVQLGLPEIGTAWGSKVLIQDLSAPEGSRMTGYLAWTYGFMVGHPNSEIREGKGSTPELALQDLATKYPGLFGGQREPWTESEVVVWARLWDKWLTNHPHERGDRLRTKSGDRIRRAKQLGIGNSPDSVLIWVDGRRMCTETQGPTFRDALIVLRLRRPDLFEAINLPGGFI